MNSTEVVYQSLRDLPASDTHLRGFAIYRGHYKMDVLWKDVNATTRVEAGGFVIGDGYLYLAVSDADKRVHAFGLSPSDAVNAAIELGPQEE